MDFEFGVLPENVTAYSPKWIVEPLPNYDDVIARWRAWGADNRWVIPPMTARMVERRDPRTGRVARTRIPGSMQQAIVWRVPPSHRLRYARRGWLDRDKASQGIAPFLIYLVGSLYGVELQQHGWGISGRQHKRTEGLFVVRPNALGGVLAHAAAWFPRQRRDLQRTAIGMLYLHNHVPSLHWDWERFAWQYVAFDAAWRLARRTRRIADPPRGRGRDWPHAQRFPIFAKKLGIKSATRPFRQWVRLRNELLHQAIWGRNMPGHQPQQIARQAYLPLRSFTTLAILAALGYRGASLRGNWQAGGQLSLDPPIRVRTFF